MATISLANVSVGAPGTFINEGTSSSGSVPVATHNSVYLLVEAPSSTPVTVFPENTPTNVFSIGDYLNLIGGSVPTSGSELLSYFNVDTLLKNAQGGAVTVIRVGQPAQVQRLSFFPTGKKNNGVAIPSDLVAGDVVYVQLQLNGQLLGEKNAQGLQRGVRVEIPATYIPGDITNNLIITQAIRDAVVEALAQDSLISASVYVRAVGSDENDGSSFIDLTGRVLGQSVSAIPLSNPIDNLYAFSLSTYSVDNLPVDQLPDQGVNDYLQTLNTSFTGQLPQGYLLAPTAFAKFKRADRVIIGDRMEAICQSPEFKWVPLIDCGPFNVTDIVDYQDFVQHPASDGFTEGQKVLIGNSIYEWTDEDYQFAEINLGSDADSSVNTADSGYLNRLALRDSQKIDLVASNGANNVITLNSDWPVSIPGYGSGLRVEVKDSNIISDGFYYIIVNDGQTSQVGITANNEIKLASTLGDALSDNSLVVPTEAAGTGVVLYSEPVFDISVTINGEESNLIEANTDNQAFNAFYLPASLQTETETFSFRNIVRRLTSDAVIGGGTLADAVFAVTAHDLQDGDIIYFNKDITAGSAVNFAKSDASAEVPYFVKVEDSNSFKLSSSLANLGDDIFIKNPSVAYDGTTEIDFFTNFEYESENNNLDIYNEVRLIRGRKYRFDTNLAEAPLLDDTGAVVADRVTRLRFVQNRATVDENGFDYSYLTDNGAVPLNGVSNIPSGNNIYYNVPTEEQDAQSGLFIVASVEDTSGVAPFSNTVLLSSDVAVNFTPESEPPSKLWNFSAVTSENLIDEALRGNNNGGVPQAVEIDSGVDSHSDLINDGLQYGTSQGFLAFYGPYVLNESNFYISPTPYVAGVAVRRYRSQGFQFPPAGVQFDLRGAVGVQIPISSQEQDVSNPLGINVLRTLPGYPANTVYIWGGRTRVNRADASERLYQFVNTRVILNVIYGSLRQAFNSEIFSSIDGQNFLFTKIKTISESLLYTLWSGGALFGSEPREAYSVICDRSNNPGNVLEDGIVQVAIYVATSPTLETIRMELIRVPIGGVQSALERDGFGSSVNSNFI